MQNTTKPEIAASHTLSTMGKMIQGLMKLTTNGLIEHINAN
jgi:hypothetical protein